METAPGTTPGWVRSVVNHVDLIPIAELKRELAIEADNCVDAVDRRSWRERLLTIRQLCGRIVDLMNNGSDEAPPPEPVERLSRRYVDARIAELPRIVAQASEVERRRALLGVSVLCEQILRTLIGLAMIGGCALCTVPAPPAPVVFVVECR